MTDDKKYDEEFGLDMSMDEALTRFAQVTKEDLAKVADSGLPSVPDGEIEVLPFKKEGLRRVFHNEEWWWSVVDMVGALTGTDRARKYWSDLKTKMVEKEGFSELSDEIGQLPLPGADGKMYRTDVATTETLFRIVQSISSPKVEPFKRWLAWVGYERIQEANDPEILIKRAILHYQVAGRSDDWIEKRIRSIVARKELTSEWQKRGVQEGVEYATLTNIMSERTFGMHTKNHAKLKGLKGQNLRDHMTDMELILTMLAETSTKEIAQQRDAQGFYENQRAASDGGGIAGNARKQIETQTGRKVVSKQNFLGSSSRTADPQALTRKSEDEK
ncbi:Bro-N domain-containing protein [Brevundimonas sp.]|uniref:BRO-N domain-containing protein n=1 Tax=Brevundimonas sp. TaxID=1871086 RepID=UPI0027F8165A|nr:Bro-N domain-containing protein [Brevundimonas sp.]MDQ7811375.1 Bro-N domain-containing protein [Brevundimonas sp.]